MVRTHQLAVGYGRREILADLSFELEPGSSLLIVGHNGAGKTTLLKSLFGLLRPLRGSLDVLGLEGSQISPRRLIERGARYLGQGSRGFPELRISQSRELLRKLYGLDPRATSFGANEHRRRVGSLSVGKRRLEALRLLSAGAPRLYFLDEPTAGADPQARQEIIKWVAAERGRGSDFVIVEQRFDELLDLCELAMVIRGRGATFFGSSAELRNSDRLVESYL